MHLIQSYWTTGYSQLTVFSTSLFVGRGWVVGQVVAVLLLIGQPALPWASKNESSWQSATPDAAPGINGCVMHTISTFQEMFVKSGVLGQPQKDALERVHPNNFTLLIYVNTSKSSVPELCPKASSLGHMLYPLLKHFCFRWSMLWLYFFPLDSCSNDFFPSHMFLCIPLHCKQTS